MENIIVGFVSLGLILYLLVTILRPEKFSSLSSRLLIYYEYFRLASVSLFIGALILITKPLGIYLFRFSMPMGRPFWIR